MSLKIAVAFAIASLNIGAYAHDHMPAGATSSVPGATLEYAPTAQDFTTNSGWVFGLNSSTTNDPYMGAYWTDDAVFIALAATPNNGGPEPGYAALGTYIQVKLLSVDGPPGAIFSFYESAGQGTDGEGIDGTNLTWTVTVPYQNGTNLIHVSESDGSPGSDPYGHIHGRVYSFSKPGYYTATWQFVDTSTNGPDGGPVDLPSAPFTLQYQADLLIDGITTDTNGVNLRFAAPSFLPDNAGPGTEPATYTLQSSPTLGAGADWQQVGDVIVGDDLMHTLNVPAAGFAQFFRLTANYPAN
jgi:hypothetical protein